MNYRLTELKVLLFLLLLSAVSCQRPMYDEEDDEDGVSQTNLPLKISARSSGDPRLIIRPISMRLQRTAAVLPV